MDNSMSENTIILLLLLFFLYVSMRMWCKITRPLFFKGFSIGTVVFIHLMENRDARKTTKLQITELPLFEFSTENGKHISSTPLFVSPLGKFKVGELLSLRYNMEKPQEFIINSAKHSLFSFPIFVTSVIVIVIIILLLIFLSTILI